MCGQFVDRGAPFSCQRGHERQAPALVCTQPRHSHGVDSSGRPELTSLSGAGDQVSAQCLLYQTFGCHLEAGTPAGSTVGSACAACAGGPSPNRSAMPSAGCAAAGLWEPVTDRPFSSPAPASWGLTTAQLHQYFNTSPHRVGSSQQLHSTPSHHICARVTALQALLTMPNLTHNQTHQLTVDAESRLRRSKHCDMLCLADRPAPARRTQEVQHAAIGGRSRRACRDARDVVVDAQIEQVAQQIRRRRWRRCSRRRRLRRSRCSLLHSRPSSAARAMHGNGIAGAQYYSRQSLQPRVRSLSDHRTAARHD